MKPFAREEKGQSIVELALFLPVIVFGLLGGADLARAYAAQNATQNASRAAAEADVIGVATSDAQVAARARDELSRVPGMAASAATVSVARTTGSLGERLSTVSVRYTFTTLVPWPLVPNSATFDRSTTMRAIQ